MHSNLTNQYISYSMAVFSANEIRTFENVFEEGKFFGQQFESFFQSFIFLSQFFNSEGSLLSLVLCLELKNKIIKNKIHIIW